MSRHKQYSLMLGAWVFAVIPTVLAACDEGKKPEVMCRFSKSLEILHGSLVRGHGNPWSQITFTIPEDGEYEFRIENEGIAGLGVYAAPGQEVVSAKHFNAHDKTYVWSGHLDAGNYEWRARVAGQPGTVARLSIGKIVVAADGPTIVDNFTINAGEAKIVSICGGFSHLRFGANALQPQDNSVTFIARCTARECSDEGAVSDQVEFTTIENQGYVFVEPPILEHPRVPFSTRQLDGQDMYAFEGIEQITNGERLVRARSFVPHFSHIVDISDVCGADTVVPGFPFPFGGKYMISQGNNDLMFTHNGKHKYDVDFAVPYEHEILAVADGKIFWRPGNNPGGTDYYGSNHLLLQLHGGEDLYYRYGHCEHLSDQLLAKGITYGGDGVPVKAGDVVCLAGNEGNVYKDGNEDPEIDGKHFHGTLVEIDDIEMTPAGGVSVPHGYQGWHRGVGADSVGPLGYKTFCPTDGTDPNNCPTEYISLWAGCIAPHAVATWTQVERAAEPALEPEIGPPPPVSQPLPQPDPSPDPKVDCHEDVEDAVMSLCVETPILGFQDEGITPDVWYYDDLQQLVCVGAIDNGFSYRPGDFSTRAEFVKVMLVVSHLGQSFDEVVGEEPFVDVGPGDWFYTPVVFAYQNGMIEGYSGDPEHFPGEDPSLKYFRPHAAVKRDEAAKLIVKLGASQTADLSFQRINNYYGCLMDAEVPLNPEFFDVPFNDDIWFYFPVQALHFFDGGDQGAEPDGIICGQSNNPGYYEPAAFLNRAEMAKIACMSSRLCPPSPCAVQW